MLHPGIRLLPFQSHVKISQRGQIGILDRAIFPQLEHPRHSKPLEKVLVNLQVIIPREHIPNLIPKRIPFGSSQPHPVAHPHFLHDIIRHHLKTLAHRVTVEPPELFGDILTGQRNKPRELHILRTEISILHVKNKTIELRDQNQRSTYSEHVQ